MLKTWMLILATISIHPVQADPRIVKNSGEIPVKSYEQYGEVRPWLIANRFKATTFVLDARFVGTQNGIVVLGRDVSPLPSQESKRMHIYQVALANFSQEDKKWIREETKRRHDAESKAARSALPAEKKKSAADAKQP